MKENSNFFDRMVKIAEMNGINGIPELAKSLGYKSPEKLYRLNRSANGPSFEIIVDLTNKFVHMNVRWLLTGEGNPMESSFVAEGTATYGQSIENRLSDLERRMSLVEIVQSDLLSKHQ